MKNFAASFLLVLFACGGEPLPSADLVIRNASREIPRGARLLERFRPGS